MNPRVQATSEELKRSFLQKKGLTGPEIELALAGSARTGPPAAARPGPPALLPPQQQLAVHPYSSPVKFSNYLGIFMNFAGKSYLGKHFPLKILMCQSISAYLCHFRYNY